jgi:uncharacterized protein (TIGR04255 family)
MISDLPEPRYEHLPAAPLALVVWQLQFAEPADVVAGNVGTELARILATDDGGAFQLQRFAAPTISIAFGPAAAPQPAAAQAPQMEGWQLRRNQLAITVGRQAAAIETTDYYEWSTLRRTIELLLGGLAELTEAPAEQRLGLRYVDRLERSDVAHVADWTRWLAPWLHGPLGHDQLRDSVSAIAGQVDFDAEAGVRATLRYRAFPDAEHRGRQTVMLDFDAFREGYRIFDGPAVLAASDGLNDVSHRLFEASVTPALSAAFAAEEPAA